MTPTHVADIHRGEIWIVDLEPALGSEQRKRRPALVIGSDRFGVLPVKLAAPITGWKDQFTPYLWFTKIEPDEINGLDKTGGIDALQVRALDASRFVRKVGRADEVVTEEVVSALAIVTEFVI